MKRFVLFAALLGLLILPLTVQARSFARWHTSLGSFTAELYDEIVPITANNFIDLTNDGFYNNLIFHRVVHNFVIQDGDPNGNGTGGPGYTIPDEFSPLLHHDQAGILAMAHTSAPNSAGSQYYITLQPTPNLDGRYAVFGKVIDGLDTVLTIGNVPVGANDRPITPVNIYQLRMLDLHVVNTYPEADTLDVSSSEPVMFIIEATSQTAQLSYDWFVDEVQVPDQHDFIWESAFPSAGEHIVRCQITSTDSISCSAYWTIRSAVANDDQVIPTISRPTMKCSPNPFSNRLDLEITTKQTAELAIDIYNLKGQKVNSLNLGAKSPGTYLSSWNALDHKGNRCAAGTYLLVLKAGKERTLVKSTLLQ